MTTSGPSGAASSTAATSILRWSACCVSRARGRRSLLRLGRERWSSWSSPTRRGARIRPVARAPYFWFQHMAIVVNDMTDAYQLVMANPRFRPVSRDGPVRLPDNSGGVTAFKFRDHDGHPLELLAFRRECPGAMARRQRHRPLSWHRPHRHRGRRLGPQRGILRVCIRVRHRNPDREPRARTGRSQRRRTMSASASPGWRWICRAPTGTAALRRGHPQARPVRTASNDIVATHSRYLSPRLTPPPRRSPAGAPPWPTVTSWSCTAASAPRWSRDLTGTASWPKSRPRCTQVLRRGRGVLPRVAHQPGNVVGDSPGRWPRWSTR